MNKTPRIGWWWPLTFGLTIGVEIMLSAFVLVLPPARTAGFMAELTDRGRWWVRPEHDLGIYAVGCALVLLLIAGFSLIWQKRYARTTEGTREEFLRQSCANISVAVVLFAAQLGLLFIIQLWWARNGNKFPWFPFGVLAVPMLASLLAGTLGYSWSLGLSPRGWVRNLTAFPSPREFPKPRFNGWADVIVGMLVGATLYMPEWRRLFRWLFLGADQCHHWDYFAGGAMVAFHYGKALGTAAYSQYGLGWPVLLSALSGRMPMPHEEFIRVAMLYGCLYFTAVFAFLRLAIGSVIWPVAGLMLVLSLQMFHGLGEDQVLWMWPSSSILRSPMDIWFFIALWAHLRGGSMVWAVLAGALAGMAVFFETDTGIYLVLALATSWVLLPGVKIEPQGRFQLRLRQAGFSFVIAAMVLAVGLAIASRGTLFRPEFWSGWLEAIFSYTAGMGMLPIGGVRPPGTFPLFALFITVYLGVLGMAVIKWLKRELTGGDVLLGCLAAYGLLTLITFVGTTQLARLFHPSVPFSLIVTLLSAKFTLGRAVAGAEGTTEVGMKELAETDGGGLAGSKWGAGRWFGALAPWCALGGMGIWLFTNPTFRYYPGVLQTKVMGWPVPDYRGPPEPDDGPIPELHATVAVIRTHVAAGRTVAVLDDADTEFYLTAGVPPWWRYSPSFPQIIWQSELAALQRAIVTRGPHYILIRGNGRFAQQWYFGEEDVWRAVHQTVASCYQLDSTIGEFEFWRRNEK